MLSHTSHTQTAAPPLLFCETLFSDLITTFPSSREAGSQSDLAVPRDASDFLQLSLQYDVCVSRTAVRLGRLYRSTLSTFHRTSGGQLGCIRMFSHTRNTGLFLRISAFIFGLFNTMRHRSKNIPYITVLNVVGCHCSDFFSCCYGGYVLSCCVASHFVLHINVTANIKQQEIPTRKSFKKY